MHHEVKEVSARVDLDVIVDVLWAAMDGVEPSHAIFFPKFSSEAHERDRAIAESKDRLWRGHENDPSSHWIYVVERENDTERIVGGCQWRIYQANPFPNPDAKVLATWWPEGVGRDFMSEVASQCHGPRKAWMARPHSGISLMCVLPEKQRQGVGSKLMEWGVKQMDDCDIEGFVEASEAGSRLYRHFGFLDIAYVHVDTGHDGDLRTEEWRELERTRLPIGYKAMWRPKQGNIPVIGVKQLWQKRLQTPLKNNVRQLI